jgi:hypothetical protein
MMQEHAKNVDEGSELHYNLSHAPLPDTLCGRIENGKSIQRFCEVNGVLYFYNNAWVDAEIEGTHVIDGHVTKDGVILVWNDNLKKEQSTIVVNYSYKGELAIDDPIPTNWYASEPD